MQLKSFYFPLLVTNTLLFRNRFKHSGYTRIPKLKKLLLTCEQFYLHMLEIVSPLRIYKFQKKIITILSNFSLQPQTKLERKFQFTYRCEKSLSESELSSESGPTLSSVLLEA